MTESSELTVFSGLRVLVMDRDTERAESLAAAIRKHGALVGTADVGADVRERIRSVDPEVIILDADSIEGQRFDVVRTIRRDPRLRWAAMLVLRKQEIWTAGAASPDLASLGARIAPLLEHDRELIARARDGKGFETRLEKTGPSRLLRALLRASGTWHVSVRSPVAKVEIDLSDDLVVGAEARVPGDEAPTQGTAALATLLTFGSAQVRVERREHPTMANVMAPIDEALGAAAEGLPESMPPVAPAAAPPAAPSPEAAPPAAPSPEAAPPATTPVAPPIEEGYDSPTIRPPDSVLESARLASAAELDLHIPGPARTGVPFEEERAAVDSADEEATRPGSSSGDEEATAPGSPGKAPEHASASDGLSSTVGARERGAPGSHGGAAGSVADPPNAGRAGDERARERTKVPAPKVPAPARRGSSGGARATPASSVTSGEAVRSHGVPRPAAASATGPAAAKPSATGPAAQTAAAAAAPKPAAPKPATPTSAAAKPAAPHLAPDTPAGKAAARTSATSANPAVRKPRAKTLVGVGGEAGAAVARPPAASSTSAADGEPTSGAATDSASSPAFAQTMVAPGSPASGGDDFPPSLRREVPAGAAAQPAGERSPAQGTGSSASTHGPASPDAWLDSGLLDVDQAVDSLARPSEDPEIDPTVADSIPPARPSSARGRILALSALAAVAIIGLASAAWMFATKPATQVATGTAPAAEPPTPREPVRAARESDRSGSAGAPAQAPAPAEAEGPAAGEAAAAPGSDDGQEGSGAEAAPARAEDEGKEPAAANPEGSQGSEADDREAPVEGAGESSMEAAGDEPLEGAGEGSMEAAGDEPAAKAEPTADPGDDEEAGHAAAGTPPHPSAIDMNAERRDPAQSDRLVIQARRAILRDKLDEAASHLERALALDPRNPRAYAGYGHFFVAQGDGRTALPWIEKAVSARPRRAPYHILLGDAKKLLGDEEGARAAWQKALRLDRDSREARERLF